MSSVDRWDRMWQDQADFNRVLRPNPADGSFEDRSQFTKDRALDLMSEVDELLRTIQWKSHRRQEVTENRPHTLEECIDIFKLWLTIVQGWGYTQQEVVDAYWRKSMVVRQRHSEEWTDGDDRPVAVVDIDGVLADYRAGICSWLRTHYPDLTEVVNQAEKDLAWIGTRSLGLPPSVWKDMKHQSRVSGMYETLPVLPGAADFLKRLRQSGLRIVLLTSRPIDRYPNLYGETLMWLTRNGLVYDWLWWAFDKYARVAEDLRVSSNVVMVVDDDWSFVKSLAKLGAPVYWVQYTTTPLHDTPSNVQIVSSVDGILNNGADYVWTTKTPDTDHMRPTKDSDHATK